MRLFWTLGRYQGSEIRLAGTWLAFFAFVVSCSLASRGMAAAAEACGVLLMTYGCVLLHELGHARAAQYYGIATPIITLYPIGGVAELERIPRAASQEFVVAAAGPAVNVGLLVAAACGLAIWQAIGGRLDPLPRAFDVFFAVNAGLLFFNLLPIFPMDGGRMVRALLSQYRSYLTATHIAARVGQCLALGMVVWGWYFQPLLILSGAFIMLAAQREWTQVSSDEKKRAFEVFTRPVAQIAN